MSERRITVADCLRVVSEEMGVSMAELLGDQRARLIARPRQVAMWAAKQATLASLPMIGRAIGDRDHTTIMHGIRTIERLRAEQETMRAASDRVLHRVLSDPGQIEMAV
jgi:chromosomal replication initiator protein